MVTRKDLAFHNISKSNTGEKRYKWDRSILLSASDFKVLNLDALLIYIEENLLSPTKLLLSAVTGVIVIYNFLLNIKHQ